MKKILVAGMLFALAGNTALADSAKGRKLHDAQCLKCHDSSVYTRPDHFITNRDALKKQVSRCQLNVGAQWFEDDVNDVVQYLDETFYKFR